MQPPRKEEYDLKFIGLRDEIYEEYRHSTLEKLELIRRPLTKRKSKSRKLYQQDYVLKVSEQYEEKSSYFPVMNTKREITTVRFCVCY